MPEQHEQRDPTRGTQDIVVAAMAYVHAEPGADDCEQYYHELETAVLHYEAVTRGTVR